MKRRLLATGMAVVVVVSMCTPLCFAITPADPLIASAAYSFILSAGIKLWREGGIQGSNEVVEDLQELYDEFVEDNQNESDWYLMGQGIGFNSGNFIYSRDSALTLQSFTNWLASRIGSSPGSEKTLIDKVVELPPNYDYEIDNTSGLSILNAGGWTLPVSSRSAGKVDVFLSASNLEKNRPNYDVSASGSDSVHMIFATAGNNKYIFYCSNDPFTVMQTNYSYRLNNETGEYDKLVSGTATAQSAEVDMTGVSVTNNGNVYKMYVYYIGGGVYLQETEFNVFNNPRQMNGVMNEMSYIVLAGERVTVGETDSYSVIGRLSDAILDVAHDIVDNGQLAIDIGLSDAATQDDAIEAVAGDYAGPAATTITDAIATPVPVEGVTELYPQPATTDIQDLGLPALGQALTSRFPFCIPFDVVNTYKSLNATAVCPVIDVDLFPQSFKSKIGIAGNTSFTINFGDQKYALLIQLIHWGSLVGFVLMLAFATKRLIWTTGG